MKNDDQFQFQFSFRSIKVRFAARHGAEKSILQGKTPDDTSVYSLSAGGFTELVVECFSGGLFLHNERGTKYINSSFVAWTKSRLIRIEVSDVLWCDQILASL